MNKEEELLAFLIELAGEDEETEANLAEAEILVSHLNSFEQQLICRDDVEALESVMSSAYITDHMPLAGFSVTPTNFGKTFVMNGINRAIKDKFNEFIDSTSKSIKKAMLKLHELFEVDDKTKPLEYRDGVEITYTFNRRYVMKYNSWVFKERETIFKAIPELEKTLGLLSAAIKDISNKLEALKADDLSEVAKGFLLLEQASDSFDLTDLFGKKNSTVVISGLINTKDETWVTESVMETLAGYESRYPDVAKLVDKLDIFTMEYDVIISKLFKEVKRNEDLIKQINKFAKRTKEAIVEAIRNIMLLRRLVAAMSVMSEDSRILIEAKKEAGKDK